MRKTSVPTLDMRLNNATARDRPGLLVAKNIHRAIDLTQSQPRLRNVSILPSRTELFTLLRNAIDKQQKSREHERARTHPVNESADRKTPKNQ